MSYCEDCGTKLSDGMCPNCHEELFIATWQEVEHMSEEFARKVEEQAAFKDAAEDGESR